MGRSRRKLFVSATVSGIALRVGIPGLADLISHVWDETREPVEAIIPQEFKMVITGISLLIFAFTLYLSCEIYLKGVKRGRKGLFTVVAGMVLGFFIGSIIIEGLVDTFGVS